MTELRRVPPGRAGRPWLTARLRSGRLAADLLERKLRVLHLERERFEQLHEQSNARWRASWRAADGWILRAAVLGGQREVRLSTTGELAEVTISWATVMGVRYPVEATCVLPEVARADRGPGTVALVQARAAYAEAVRAAAAQAAVVAARRVVDAEIAVTQRRRRAIMDRWVPRLEAALRSLTHELDEAERADTFRLRWAGAGQNGDSP